VLFELGIEPSSRNDACSFISLYIILNSVLFVGLTGSGSDGITIWYRIDSEGCYAQVLENFTGTSIASLQTVMKVDEELAHPACMLKLVVIGSDKIEIGLDEVQNGWEKQGIPFNFAKLISDYNINLDNPIRVKLPGW
jgi:hypothetical protein